MGEARYGGFLPEAAIVAVEDAAALGCCWEGRCVFSTCVEGAKSEEEKSAIQGVCFSMLFGFVFFVSPQFLDRRYSVPARAL